ncbi:FliM/FliN family flagellar motor switch protein [Rubellimicrobium sp. CFH 75288]|uniref:FliM/FliN family flagellar motor switch protein n=1 Tax=Rubellimicrobium sp. CFH 75288 TaxID=2697034 RepID=UPI0014120ECA|nr:FliM/FliN family flagellar motor C-terminal domain-containing protein [Rubellimicrobium sp. CFH 75288]NAZ37875.1 hypothetical protein [Rubellimicrobium sp. CFH 75288]
MEAGQGTGLRRLLRSGGLRADAQGSTRSLRLAVVRAAEQGAGLRLTVLGLRQEEAPLDDLLADLGDDLLIVLLRQGSDPAGLAALDAGLRDALIEAQLAGTPSPLSPDPRPSTGTDAALAAPFLAALLAGFEAVSDRAASGPAPRPAERLGSARDAALVLTDGAYRAVRMTLDLGPKGREGGLTLLRPAPERRPVAASPGPPALLEAEARLDVILARIPVELSALEGWEAGMVVPLPGADAASVRLVAPDGTDCATARLGQAGGRRAVRLDGPPAGGAGPASLPQP